MQHTQKKCDRVIARRCPKCNHEKMFVPAGTIGSYSYKCCKCKTKYEKGVVLDKIILDGYHGNKVVKQ